MLLEYPTLKVTYSFYEGEDIFQKMVISVTPNAIKEEEWFWGDITNESPAVANTNTNTKTYYEVCYYEITTSGEYYRYKPEDIRYNEGEHISYHRYDSDKEEVYQSFEDIKTTFAVFCDMYDDIKYDSIQKAYKLDGFKNVEESPVTNILLYFADGRLSKVSLEAEGTDVTTVVIEFEYDNVEVVLPNEYHTDSSTTDCAYWRPGSNH